MSAARKAVARAGEARATLVVMKFGGTSVEDAAAILRTTAIVRGRRERGPSPVVVVSAMAKVTDKLIGLAHEVSPQPEPRELDVLLCTGEQQ